MTNVQRTMLMIPSLRSSIHGRLGAQTCFQPRIYLSDGSYGRTGIASRKSFTTSEAYAASLMYLINQPDRIGKDDLLSVVKPTWGLPSSGVRDTEYDKDIKATWLGHACFLVEFPTIQATGNVKTSSSSRGLRVLFDPWVASRTSSLLI